MTNPPLTDAHPRAGRTPDEQGMSDRRNSLSARNSVRHGAPGTASTKQRWRDFGVGAALLVLFLAGAIGLAAATGWQDTRAQLLRLEPWQLGGLLVLSLVNYGLRGLRWHLFSRALGLGLPMTADLRHFIGGFAMSVTPGRLGELVRMRWIGRETGWRFVAAAPLMLADRASDLAAMALILAGGTALAAGGMAGSLPSAAMPASGFQMTGPAVAGPDVAGLAVTGPAVAGLAVAGLAVAALALAAAVLATRPRLLAGMVALAWRATGRNPRRFARARRSARSLSVFSRRSVMAPALALGVAGWMVEAFAFHLLLVWMGADIGLAKAAAIFILATLAGGLTGAPGGLGGAEAAMIALLGLEGVPLDVAVPATVIIRVTTLWFALLLGLAVFPLAEHHSRKGRHLVEIR